MTRLNRDLLSMVKKGFVPMPGGQTEPVAGASPMTAAMGAPMGGGGMPMDPAMMGGDPAAMGGGGMPMDPAAMGGGGMPMDPAAMGGGGGMPMDPAMMGGDPAAMGGDPAAMGGGDPMAGVDPAALQSLLSGTPADPAAMGGDPMAAGGEPTVTIPVSSLLEILKIVKGEPTSDVSEGGDVAAEAPGAEKPKKLGTSAKLDMILQALGQAPDAGGAPPMGM